MPTPPDRSPRIYRFVNEWPKPAGLSIDLESSPDHGEVWAILRLAGVTENEGVQIGVRSSRPIVYAQLRAAARRLRERHERQARDEIA